MAATYYVSTIGLSGNDGSLPTQGADNHGPLDTIVRAMNTVVAGDTIKVLPGTYDTDDGGTYGLIMDVAVTLQAVDAAGANATSGVTIKATADTTLLLINMAAAGTTNINGITWDVVDADNAKTSGLVTGANAGTINFTDCTFLDSAAFGVGIFCNLGTTATAKTLTFTRCSFTDVSTTAFLNDSGATAHSVVFTDCVFDVTSAIPFKRKPGVTTFTGCSGSLTASGAQVFLVNDGAGCYAIDTSTFTVSAAAIVFELHGDGHLDITNSTITMVGNHAEFISRAYSSHAGRVYLKNNTFVTPSTMIVGGNKDWMALAGAGSGGYDVEMISNTLTMTNAVASAAANILNIQCRDKAKIEHNTFDIHAASGTTAVVRITGSGAGGAAAALVRVVGNLINVRYQASYVIALGTELSVAATDNQLNGALVADNVILGPRYHGITNGDSSMHAILIGCNLCDCIGNYVYGCGYGIVVKGTNTVSDYSASCYEACRGNIFVDNDYYGIVFKGTKGARAIDNTIVRTVAMDHYVAAIALDRPAVAAENYAINTVLRGNIVVDLQDGVYIKCVSDGDAGGLNSDYNVFWGTDTDDFIVGATTYPNFVEYWQLVIDAKPAYDAHSVFADPMFNNWVQNDYRLKSNSPAIRMTAQVPGLGQVAPGRFTRQAACGAREVAWDRYFKRRGERL